MKKLILLIVAFLPVFCLAQSSKDNKSNHYLYPEFRQATVKMKSGKVQQASMNYHLVTEEMIYPGTSRMLAVDQLETIDTILIGEHRFIPFGNKFYEQLYQGKVPLFIQHKRNLSPGGTPVGYGATSQTAAVSSIKSLSASGRIYDLKLPEDMVISEASLYWIIWNNKMESFLNERQLLRIFPEKKKEIKMFLNENEIDFKNRDHMVLLMGFLNKLL